MLTIEHKLLTKQIRNLSLSIDDMPEPFLNLLKIIENQYKLMERDRDLLSRSLAVMSDELTEQNTALQKEKEDQHKLIKRLEETHNQLLQSEKMASIGQLAAGVAHEINNPIGYVLSNVTSLRKYMDDIFRMLEKYQLSEPYLPEKTQLEINQFKSDIDIEFLREDSFNIFNESTEGIHKVKKIVENLKEFSRIDNAKDWEESDIHKGLDSTLNIAANEIKYRANVIKDYGTLPLVYCKLSEINQVFLNLIINACQAFNNDALGTITIKTWHDTDDKKVYIMISDNGCGIPEENLKKIFDPFFTTKPIGVGTGLGLSISYGIIQKHKGSLRVESDIGKGTTFLISLPL